MNRVLCPHGRRVRRSKGLLEKEEGPPFTDQLSQPFVELALAFDIEGGVGHLVENRFNQVEVRALDQMEREGIFEPAESAVSLRSPDKGVQVLGQETVSFF